MLEVFNTYRSKQNCSLLKNEKYTVLVIGMLANMQFDILLSCKVSSWHFWASWELLLKPGVFSAQFTLPRPTAKPCTHIIQWQSSGHQFLPFYLLCLCQAFQVMLGVYLYIKILASLFCVWQFSTLFLQIEKVYSFLIKPQSLNYKYCPEAEGYVLETLSVNVDKHLSRSIHNTAIFITT